MATLFNCLASWSDAPAVIVPSPRVTLSHSQLLVQCLSCQNKLASFGIGPKDVVAVALPNSTEFVILFIATTFQRATAAPLNPAYKQDEFQFYLDDLKAAVLLVPQGAQREDGEAIRAAKACGVRILEVFWNGYEIDFLSTYSNESNGRVKHALQRAEENDIALVLHTSGTTGRPKAVPLTHGNICRTMANIQATYNLTVVDRGYLVMPLFHVHGLLAGFLAPLMSGGSIVVPQRFSASDFWPDFLHLEANWYTAVPTIHQILLRNTLPAPMPKIRFVRSCSSPLSPTVHKQLETALGAPVIEAYAMTEASHQITSNPLPPYPRKPGSVGVPQGVEVKILSGDGEPLPPGDIGEVCIFGPNVTSGYIGSGFQSPFTADGYFRTGDQGFIDNDGYLTLTGRIKELINKGGEKISPIEIDNLFSQHPSVAEAISFAIDDELYGQDVAVAVTLREGEATSASELLAWFAERAVRFKIPKKLYLTDHLPKTATGKVQRRLVAEAMSNTSS